MQDNQKFLTQKEIEEIGTLSYYQRIQLKIHGNILREGIRLFPFTPRDTSTNEDAYIYSLENEKQ